MGSLNGKSVKLTVRSHPLPLTEAESVVLDYVLIVLAAMFVLIPFCYLTGAFAINPVQERVARAHHMQVLN